MSDNEFRVAPVKPLITIAEFEKIDIRAGTIVSVEDVTGSDKLVWFFLMIRRHPRSILAGMKRERANPKAIAGAQALFVVNLEPRKMLGEMSQGMLFDIGYADGIKPVLAMPEKAVPNGARAG